MNWLTIMHEGSTVKNMTKGEQELKQYAKSEGLSFWCLRETKPNKKKKK